MSAILDFAKELDMLLAYEQDCGDIQESLTLDDILNESQRVFGPYFEAVGKAQTDISMQVEEIYDILQSAESDKENFRDEQNRVNGLVRALVGLADMIEDFYLYARYNDDADIFKQAEIMWKNTAALMESCAVLRLGKEGQSLDPGIHNVHAAAPSDLPKEVVLQVLRSGYRFKGDILRKATVIVSLGREE